jgi:hypothetical protein
MAAKSSNIQQIEHVKSVFCGAIPSSKRELRQKQKAFRPDLAKIGPVFVRLSQKFGRRRKPLKRPARHPVAHGMHAFIAQAFHAFCASKPHAFAHLGHGGADGKIVVCQALTFTATRPSTWPAKMFAPRPRALAQPISRLMLHKTPVRKATPISRSSPMKTN